LSLDYSTDQPPLAEDLRDLARYADGSLRIVSKVPNGSQGLAAAGSLFADVIVQAQIALSDGADDDLYGLFVRSPTSDLYYTFAVSPSGHVLVSTFENGFQPVVSGPLDPDMLFAHGLGQPNRFQVVAVGPSLTFLLNGMLITAEIVDERFREGYLGFFVHHGSSSPQAELAADWIQVRGVFAEG
jgi:hypothetical protein